MAYPKRFCVKYESKTWFVWDRRLKEEAGPPVRTRAEARQKAWRYNAISYLEGTLLSSNTGKAS
jgi:hypothetical protein